MTPTSGSAPMVLYHAISTYQLLEVMLHRQIYHPNAKAVLLLPDFIKEKYPHYRRQKTGRFFNEVYLFPYLQIPHREESSVALAVNRSYRRVVPYEIEEFGRVYVAGAHFYFSLYLINKGIPFTFFEDAAGCLSRGGELYRALAAKYPLHAQIALRHGLFDGTNPLARRVVCLKSAQSIDVSAPKFQNFSVEEALLALPSPVRRRLLRFFWGLRPKIRTNAQGILLTQHLANLGVMSLGEQKKLYENLRDGPLKGVPLFIKVHPDDTLDYRDIFPQAQIMRRPFPAELLPYLFYRRPRVIYTADSTGCENLKKHFMIEKLGRDLYVP